MSVRCRQWRWRLLAIVSFVLGTSHPTIAFAQSEHSLTHSNLEKVAQDSNVEITTTGRKSGKPHTRPIWFVYDQGRFYIQAGRGGKTDWYLNLKKNPQLTLKIGTVTLTGSAKFIEDEKETERVHRLFRTKYTGARLANLVGSSIGHGKVVEVELQE